MPATYPSFATPDQYAAWIGVTPPPDGVQELLDAASSTIRRYCGWHVAPVVTEQVVVDGRGGHSQLLPTLRLVDLLALSIWQVGGTDLVIDPLTVEWSRDGYLRQSACARWPERLRGITATIEHGFEDYGDLAIMSMTMVARATTNPYGLTSQAVGGVSIGMSTTASGQAGGVVLFDGQMAELDSYRIFGRP
jgi:hypothetical protein